jgi:hypothetical protein
MMDDKDDKGDEHAAVSGWLAGETKVLGKKPDPVPLCPLQIPQNLSWARTQVAIGRIIDESYKLANNWICRVQLDAKETNVS